MKKPIDLHQLRVLLVSHTKELLREPAVLFWGVVFPLLMTLGLGLAFTQKSAVVRRIAVIVDSSSASGNNGFESFLNTRTTKEVTGKNVQYKLVIKDEKLGNKTYYFTKMNWNQATVLLKRGEIGLVLEETKEDIKYHFDPVNSDAQLTYLNVSAVINGNKNPAAQSRSGIEALSLKGTRYIDFLVPGLMSMGIMLSSIWGLGYNLIEKRSKKLLRRMIATPMKKSYFLISLMTVRASMNFVEAVMLFIFSYLVFHVTIEGSIPALILLFITSNIAFAGIAAFTASRTASTEVGNGIINAVTTPMMVLSGIFFSYHNFPDWAVSFIKFLPLTILADGFRSIFIEGAGFAQTYIPMLILTAIGIICFTIGLKLFKWH